MNSVVLRQEGVVNRVSVLNVVHGEPICAGFMREPGFGRIDKRLVNPALLGDGNNLELRQRLLSESKISHTF